MATDNFTATNDPLASPWIAVTNMGSIESVGGEARNSGLPLEGAMVYSTSVTLFSQVTLSDRTGGGADFNGVGLWDPATGNGYLATITGAISISRYAAGAYSNNWDTAGSAAQGDTLSIEIEGDDIVVKKNGVEVHRQTDTTYRTGLKPGLYLYGDEGGVDDWTDGASASSILRQMMMQH